MASLAGYFNFQQITSSGDAANGYRMYTYTAGTTTHKPIYTDPAGNIPHTYTSDGLGGQYIALNERGELPAPMFLATGGYDIALKTSAGATVWTRRAYGTEDTADTNDATLRADLADETSSAVGAGMVDIGPLIAYTSKSIGGWLRDVVISANSYTGVDTTGATDSAVALQTLLNAVPNGSVVRLRGTYTCSEQAVVITGKSITIDARGATINMAGNSRGFRLVGVVAWAQIMGGTWVGDAVNRDSLPDGSYGIRAWTIGNDSGAQVSNVTLADMVIRDTNAGIVLADGRGGGGTKTKNCRIVRCSATNIVGFEGGRGYGFQFSQADGSSIADSVADTCGRHGYYFSEGRNYQVTNARATNCGNGGSIRGAFSVARSAHVVISGLICENNDDVGLVIDTDEQGLTPDNVLNDVVVTAYAAAGNLLGDLRIGTSDTPGTSNYPTNVSVQMQALPAAGATSSSVVIGNGKNIRVHADIVGGTGSTYRAITLLAQGGATYTDKVHITGNWSSGGYCVQIPSSLQTGTTKIKLLPDRCEAGVAAFEFLGGEDATTNPNLRYMRENGVKPSRTVTAAGTGQTPAVGGLGVLHLAPTSAAEYTGFTGLDDGEEILVVANNNNATLKQSATMYLDGSADIALTSADVIKFRRFGSILRQISPVVVA